MENDLKNHLYPFENEKINLDPLLESIKDKKIVFIGESTHGTHEFYQIRAELTRQLIMEYGFNAVVIEGDWPDTYHINEYVKGNNNIKTPLDALRGFKRFPIWMWRNKVVEDFIYWLHQHNTTLENSNKIGFYGLDLYSLNASIEVIIKYLEKEDKEAAERAKERYSCFDHFKEELQQYGLAASLGITQSCEDAVVEQLVEINSNALFHLKQNGAVEEEYFDIEQNAFLIKNAEKYYRSMFSNKTSSWNVRDTHMASTLDNLYKYLSYKLNKPAKIIVWAHNSHIGDARYTEFGQIGQLNIGQLAREKYKDKVALIGFLTHSGTVSAASNWDGPVERRIVRHGIHGSYEYFFHHLNIPNFLMLFNKDTRGLIPKDRLERAIGVIYLPARERTSHYFYAEIAKQFDALIYVDKTTALEPLETTAIWHEGEILETFPSGL